MEGFPDSKLFLLPGFKERHLPRVGDFSGSERCWEVSILEPTNILCLKVDLVSCDFYKSLTVRF